MLEEKLFEALKEHKKDFIVGFIKDLQTENEKLKERVEYLERSIERQEEKAIGNYNDYIGILTNWNKLKEWLNEDIQRSADLYFQVLRKSDILDKMQELEKR